MKLDIRPDRSDAVGGPPAMTQVVVQQRQRLFRDGIGQLLAAEPDVEVVAMATTDAELVAACRQHGAGVALIEADAPDWDVIRLVGTLRRTLPHLAVIGLTAPPVTPDAVARARRDGMSALLPRSAGIAGILAAIRETTDPSIRRRPTARSRSLSTPSTSTVAVLTGRELEVLSLIGAGLTSVAVSNRLQISHKTVENHKQRVFAKLGVQNQAHAVSVAMRTGLLRPDRVVALAVGD